VNDEEEPRESDAATVLLRVFEERTRQSVLEEEKIDFDAQRVWQRTNRITLTSVVSAIALTPFIFYLIGTLMSDMGTISEQMGIMRDDVAAIKTDFDEVAVLMSGMDNAVSNMTHSIEVVPLMSTEAAGMNNNFSLMVGAMNGITPNVSEIDRLLAVMDYDMAHMSNLFDHINRHVLFMGRDVNTMSGPMRMMPFFGR
jgi:hypothetical protein